MSADPGASGGPITFERSAGRQAIEGAGAGCGAVLFLGMAGLFLTGVISPGLEFRIIGAVGFGFFGLLMAAAAASSAGRGNDPRVAEVGPTGLWLPEMGWLRWSEIAEVRLERIRGVGGGDAAVTRQFRRLGVVPRDRALRPAGATSLAWRLSSAYFAFLRLVAPQIRLGGDDAAPFGVTETEIPRDFERLLEAVGRHTAIVDAAQARAAARAGRWAASSREPSDRPEPTSAGALRALDDALAPGAGGSPAGAPAGTATSPLVAATDAPSPRGSFSVPAVSPIELIVAVVPLVVPLFIALPLMLPMAMSAGPPGMIFLVLIGVFLAAFVVPGAIRLVRLARRVGERRRDRERLRVGPEGIWTRDAGLTAWPDVRGVRTERAGWVRQIGTPSFERWRLVIETVGGATAGVASDELDARFDEVLDLVRLYHPVVETS